MSGLSDKLTGKAKQTAGDITGDQKLKNEGKLEEVKGTLKDKLNETIDTVTETVDDAKKKLEEK